MARTNRPTGTPPHPLAEDAPQADAERRDEERMNDELGKMNDERFAAFAAASGARTGDLATVVAMLAANSNALAEALDKQGRVIGAMCIMMRERFDMTDEQFGEELQVCYERLLAEGNAEGGEQGGE